MGRKSGTEAPPPPPSTAEKMLCRLAEIPSAMFREVGPTMGAVWSSAVFAGLQRWYHNPEAEQSGAPSGLWDVSSAIHWGKLIWHQQWAYCRVVQCTSLSFFFFRIIIWEVTKISLEHKEVYSGNLKKARHVVNRKTTKHEISKVVGNQYNTDFVTAFSGIKNWAQESILDHTCFSVVHS